MNHGFVKVASAIPYVKVADCEYNAKQIESLIQQASSQNVSIITFPEFSITGYTCGDLFAQELLLSEAEQALIKLLNDTRQLDIISIIGTPIEVNSTIINAAVVIQKGKILGIAAKTYLPNYKEFYEQRWFTSALQLPEKEVRLCGQVVPIGANLLFNTPETTFAIEICEDLWATIPPSSTLSLQGAEIIFNLSADNENMGKHDFLCALLSQQSARCLAGYVFSSCGFGESTTDTVFTGNALIYENGKLLCRNRRFSFEEQLIISEIDTELLRSKRRINTTFAANRANIHNELPKVIFTERDFSNEIAITRSINKTPFIPSQESLPTRCEESYNIQIFGLAQRLKHIHCEKVVVGISGGLDSTLALLVCIKTFDKLGLPRKNIIGVTMPGFGTTDRTYNNAMNLMKELGITIREISIREACLQHFKDIEHNIEMQDVTYENSQARERTQILMDVANQMKGIVIGTGDLSELALGWATFNGDQMSMYGVNASIPKTFIPYLIRWIAKNEMQGNVERLLLDIIDTPISPELIPADDQGMIKQKTEDLVGPYELHDFFLYHFLEHYFRPSKIYFLAQKAFEGKYDDETIKKWLYTFFRRFFAQQFKRSSMPDGPKVGSISLSPRGDWRMPSDASSEAWLKEIGNL